MTKKVTLDEKDSFRKILVQAEDDEKIPAVSYPGREFDPGSNNAYIEFTRTNIYSGELLGNQNSLQRFRNTFFITMQVNIPKAWVNDGKDPEYEAELVVAELFELFPPRSFIAVVGTGYASHGIKVEEVETEDEKMFGARETLEIDEAQDIYFREYLRLRCEHIYLLPRV